MVKAKVYKYIKDFSGEPKSTDVEIIEEELPPLKNGEFLCKAVYLSVDPYMRPYMARYQPGITMIGSQVAEIIESKNDKFPLGKFVVGYFGWRDYTISNGTEERLTLLSNFGNFPLSLALGTLGMPGTTANLGFLNICKPKEDETVVVSGAAGAVGNIVGQIAKIKGCKVIGIAGSNEKCKWIKELGFDYAINYKTENVSECLKRFAPNGVDCYFDNVGGSISTMVMNEMNEYGRISVCGSISSYNSISRNSNDLPKEPVVQPTMIFKQLKMEGFCVYRWPNETQTVFKQHMEWLLEGKLKYRETVTKGFENMFNAFISMLTGGNIGKAIVEV